MKAAKKIIKAILFPNPVIVEIFVPAAFGENEGELFYKTNRRSARCCSFDFRYNNGDTYDKRRYSLCQKLQKKGVN